ncbi:MAG: type I restriction enzyme HsdR N-terminal domain-containing protein [Marinobacter sp.]|nr:type I restriction enzyme HsdR N-terminal domain-containing protein [Marinobacter sp.]
MPKAGDPTISASSHSEVRPEAELETKIANALNTAFPHLPGNLIKQQRSFTVRLGHEERNFDSGYAWTKTGRADLILSYRDRALAVLEVKREDKSLNTKDFQQAQSYAALMTPRPPLVVVTNGNETCVYDSNTGQAISAQDLAAEGIERIFSNAAKVAAADLQWATEALMGRDTDVWVPIVREASAALIDELCDAPGDTGQPFARDLIIPRQSSQEVLAALQDGTQFVVVSGAPSVGKTNLLREFAVNTYQSNDFAVLLLRGDPGPGLYQSLADLFSEKLEWNLSSNDCLQWLRRMAKGPHGPALVLAIDGVEPGSKLASDLEHLARIKLGDQLKVILTTDQPESLVKNRNGRNNTALGSYSYCIEMGALNSKEFRAAMQAFSELGITFEQGAEFCEDYRSPWVLRTLYDEVAQESLYFTKGMVAHFYPSLGLELIKVARKVFSNHHALLRGYRILARDYLADSHPHDPNLALAAAHGFIIRQDTISIEGRERLANLTQQGWTREYRHPSGEDIVIPTSPAAFLIELAAEAGKILAKRATDDSWGAGQWLGRRMSGLYLGDLVGAQAIVNVWEKTGGFSYGIVKGLLDLKPDEQPLLNGEYQMALPDGDNVILRIENQEAWISTGHGKQINVTEDLGLDECRLLGQTTPWLILGQIARLPSATAENENQRIEAQILLEIGQCGFPLLRATDLEASHQVHDLHDEGQVLCVQQGVIEPTTLAMVKLLSSSWPYKEDWIECAVRTNSLPLIHRIYHALNSVIPAQRSWAQGVAQEVLKPAINARLDELH